MHVIVIRHLSGVTTGYLNTKYEINIRLWDKPITCLRKTRTLENNFLPKILMLIFLPLMVEIYYCQGHLGPDSSQQWEWVKLNYVHWNLDRLFGGLFPTYHIVIPPAALLPAPRFYIYVLSYPNSSPPLGKLKSNPSVSHAKFFKIRGWVCIYYLFPLLLWDTHPSQK